MNAVRQGIPRALLLIVALAMLPAAAQGGVSVALQPATQTVAPGAEFDLYVAVTESGSAFNAFDAVVGYAPSALTLVQLSPLSLQEGTMMTAACASRFHRFRVGGDRDTITDALLCSGVSVSGPGQIYRLRFQASNTPQTTSVQFLPGVRFFDAGLAVTPVTVADATIVISGSVGVVATAPARMQLIASPNPSRSLTMLRVEADQAGLQELVVSDLMGRIVRRLGGGWFESGARECVWDGRDEAGARVPPGIYYARLRSSRGVLRAAVARIE